MNPEDLKNHLHVQYSKDNWSHYKTMVEAYADVLDCSAFLSGVPAAPEEAVAKAAFEKKRSNLRFQILKSLGTNSAYINGLKTKEPYEIWKKLLDTHESTSEASVSQMFREIIHLRREPGETVRDSISRVNGKLNRLEAAMEEKSIDLHKLLRKNRLLEILGDDYPSLKEHLFLTEGLESAQLEARILEATERIDIERDQNTHRVSQASKSDKAVTVPCGYCLQHFNKKLYHPEYNCFKKHPEKRFKDSDTKHDGNRDAQNKKADPNSLTSLKKANKLMRKALEDNNIKKSSDGTYQQAWLATRKRTGSAFTVSTTSTNDSIIFDVDTGAENHYIPTAEAHKLDNYSTLHSGHTVVCANNTEEITAGCGSIKGKLGKIYTMNNFPHALLSVPTLVRDGKAALFHPAHGVIIAAATDFKVKYRNPLLIGKLDDGMYRVKVHTSPKTYAKAAAGPPTPLNQKLIAKAQLHLERFGYPSPDRIILLAKDPAYNLDLPRTISKDAFRVDENDVYQIGKSHAQPNRDLNMKVTASKPWQLVHIDISYIEPGYKGEKYQLTASCDFTGATITDTLKSKDQLVPCLKR